MNQFSEAMFDERPVNQMGCVAAFVFEVRYANSFLDCACATT
jgi:hypothetical protein